MTPRIALALGAFVAVLIWISMESLAALFFGVRGPVLRGLEWLWKAAIDPGDFGGQI